MDEKEREKEKHISYLELEDEELGRELSVEQKKAMIAEAKARYGRDWKKIIGGAFKSLRVNTDTLHTLHGLGIDGSLRKYNDPSAFSKRSRVEEAFRE